MYKPEEKFGMSYLWSNDNDTIDVELVGAQTSSMSTNN